MRQVAVQLPDDVALVLERGGRDLSRRTLEAIALEAFGAGDITEAEVQRLLGIPSRWETMVFLKDRHVYLDYTEADLNADLAAVRRVGK